MNNEPVFFWVGLVAGLIVGSILAYGTHTVAWENAYRAVKQGTIEKEIKTRNPALWLELNIPKE